MTRALAALALSLLLGLLTGSSLLVYSAYVLMAVGWSSHYLSRRWTEALVAVRTISSAEIEVGQKVQVQLRLNNRDTWAVWWVLIDDVLPRRALFDPPTALILDGKSLRICSLPAKSSRIVNYQLTALRRGYYQIGPAIAETGDLLGLHRRFRMLVPADCS